MVCVKFDQKKTNFGLLRFLKKTLKTRFFSEPFSSPEAYSRLLTDVAVYRALVLSSMPQTVSCCRTRIKTATIYCDLSSEMSAAESAHEVASPPGTSGGGEATKTGSVCNA